MVRRSAARQKKSRLHRPLHILTAVLALVWAVLALCWYIEDRFEPVLDELAEYEAQAAVNRAVNIAITAEMAAHPHRFAGVYTVQYNGKVPTVQADAAGLNAACLALVTAANTALADLPPVYRRVPFGTLTGFSLLNNLGPGWPLCFTPQAYAEGSVRETAQTVGINQISYLAVLDLRISVNMVLDGKNRVLNMTQTVPLASVIVGGDTPLYYAAGA